MAKFSDEGLYIPQVEEKDEVVDNTLEALTPDQSRRQNALSLPSDHGPQDRQVGEDELGQPLYRTVMGNEYTLPLYKETAPKKPVSEAVSDLRMPNRVDAQNVGMAVATALWEAISGPAKAARGESTTIGDAVDVAGVAVGGATGARAAGVKAPEGSTGMFVGAQAKGVDLDALDEAMQYADGGMSRNEIWRETGWMFDEKDRRWVTELPDDEFALPLRGKLELTERGELRGTDDMFEGSSFKGAYPESYQRSDVSLEGGGRGGSFNRETKAIEAKGHTIKEVEDTILHELQHAAQRIEGFEGGSNTEWTEGLVESFFKKVPEEAKTYIQLQGEVARLADEIELFQSALDTPPRKRSSLIGDSKDVTGIKAHIKQTTDKLEEYNNLIEGYRGAQPQVASAMDYIYDLVSVTPFELYMRSKGEAQARLTTNRRDLTADERRNIPPWQQLDVDEQSLWTYDEILKRLFNAEKAIRDSGAVPDPLQHMIDAPVAGE